jgi:hypothetical protein
MDPGNRPQRRAERIEVAGATRSGPIGAQSSEIHRLGSGVGEGNRTPDLQNHNLAL